MVKYSIYPVTSIFMTRSIFMHADSGIRVHVMGDYWVVNEVTRIPCFKSG